MNRIPDDVFYRICLFLEAQSLARLSSVDRTRKVLLQDAASWPPSELKPHQVLTSKDKVIHFFRAFLENLKIDQPSRFFVGSPTDDIRLKIEIFCSKGNPILPHRDFSPNWQIPKEKGSSDTAMSRNPQRTSIYNLPNRPELSMAWGESYRIGLSGPSHFTTIGADENFLTFLQQSVQQRIDNLKANEERRLIENLQALPADEQPQFITNHNENLIALESLQAHVEQGARSASGAPLRANT